MKKKKIKVLRIIFIVFLGLVSIYLLINNNTNNEFKTLKMIDLTNKNISEIEEYAKENSLELEIKYEYSKEVEKDKVISQSIDKNAELTDKNKNLIIVISKGKIGKEIYQEYSVNELGEVPIMMYHGIENIEETNYIGGNVDKDGYNRTVNAFKQDLEFYYNEGYRMVRLVDYALGDIEVELGKSPIVLTFDDGNKNNFNVLGIDENGNLEIDPNCAIGILESFKKKYPDYNVTATFFLMDNLFNQSEYDEAKLKWLVENGYDIGNHTKTHVNYKNVDSTTAQSATGYMYEKLESIIPGKYVKIIALPFGSPGKKDHANFQYVLKGIYNGKEYTTDAALRVGWTSEVSPFNKNFDKTFLKRVRAYDNNGKDFDITYVFNNLKNNKYISDGDKDTIVIPTSMENKLGETFKEVIKY
ncbi:MAG: polysaccharide deacetylase family protein [Bacilli bacterium]|nr:polysaccharide deacetylase family protein [Bacilli bacterium]